MPRRMPRFDLELSAVATEAIAVARAGEVARVSPDKSVRKEWTPKRLEALYELAYLRVFAAWEIFQENVFYRSLCGYAGSAGQETLVSGAYYQTIPAAESAVLAGQAYVLWANPSKVIARCRRFIKSGSGCPALQELTLSSNVARLEGLASTRHRIVHEQKDARKNFDAATLLIAGTKYPASRPGKFLRDLDPATTPSRRWLDVVIRDLTSLAAQMV
jgi:hypothetical protein